MRDVTKVFVAGDLMLDRFEYGKVSRISPEAPVPIFRHEREKRMLGGVFELCRKAQELGYLIVVISNQSGVSRGYYTEVQMNACNAHMCAEFAKRGITVTDVLSCTALDDADPDRKPNPGMFLKAISRHGIDPAASVAVGDSERDSVAARRAGVGTVILLDSTHALSGIDLTSVEKREDSFR